MANIGLLEFTERNLAVSYRASEEPQLLTMKVKLDEPKRHYGNQGDMLVEAINYGMAGGAQFAPMAGRARIISGDFASLVPGRKALALQELEFVMEVSGVCPYFLRTMVEQMRSSTVAMSIRGSLPLDDSPFSVTEAHLKRWFDDPKAYMGLWDVPYFDEQESVLRGASIRVAFHEPISEEAVEKAYGLGWRFVEAACIVTKYIDHTEQRPGAIDLNPTIKRSKKEVTVKFELFDLVREPTRALFLNMLTHFHHTVQPIRAVSIKFS